MKTSTHWTRSIATVVLERCMHMMPEDSPPKVIMSGVSRIQEQNEQIITLLRDRLGAQEAAAGEPAALDGERGESVGGLQRRCPSRRRPSSRRPYVSHS